LGGILRFSRKSSTWYLRGSFNLKFLAELEFLSVFDPAKETSNFFAVFSPNSVYSWGEFPRVVLTECLLLFWWIEELGLMNYKLL
jgi:hypothetical protein